eukprot:5271183-Ditylum_brightwellii.AAC.1
MHFDSKEEVTNCADVHSFYEEDSEIRKPADGYSKDLTDAKNGHATGQNNNRNGEKNRQKSKGVAPLGAGMLPTPGIYGGLLAALPLDVLEKNLDQTIMNSGGVLGKVRVEGAVVIIISFLLRLFTGPLFRQMGYPFYQ